MDAAVPIGPPSATPELLTQAQIYLTARQQHLPTSQDLEAAWSTFYDHYSHKIRVYAFTCGVEDEEILDCVQEVWRELLVRLSKFQLDPCRGQFDTWLFRIVQGKTADLRRSRKRWSLQGNSDGLKTVSDSHPSCDRVLEEKEMAALAWEELRASLSESDFQLLQLRLVEQRSVKEVAEKLGLSQQQVWYHYHRARRKLAEIGAKVTQGQPLARPSNHRLEEKKEKGQDFAQGKAGFSVSPDTGKGRLGSKGGGRVDLVFRKVELGRRFLVPEWKVEWDCTTSPTPILYQRKLSIVAYAEICGPEDGITSHWPRILQAAVTAGIAAGIATIIATPTAALPIFRSEFKKYLQSKAGNGIGDNICVALSANQEANGPWCVCKD